MLAQEQLEQAERNRHTPKHSARHNTNGQFEAVLPSWNLLKVLGKLRSFACLSLTGFRQLSFYKEYSAITKGGDFHVFLQRI